MRVKFLLLLLCSSLLLGCSPKKDNGKIIINEALRTLLYLPLYHAQEGGFFAANGLEIQIVTGGTATNSFASMLAEEAHFSQADPMYVPIANEKGSNTKVVAQVVSRIAVWGVTMDSTINGMSETNLRNKSISTHPRPMTAYTYTLKTIDEANLEPDKDVRIIETTPGTEIGPLISGQSDFALTLEPNVSRAVHQGAKVVLSYPVKLGDQIFTGLMAKQDYILANPETVRKVVLSYQQAMDDIYEHPENALVTAKQFFPQIEEEVIEMAIRRMLDEQVIPKTVLMSDESWNKAIKVRVDVGDLKRHSSRDENIALGILQKLEK